jgi:hypothetical protein
VQGGKLTPKPISQNTLFYGDNLTILREHIADESASLTRSRLYLEGGGG